jgi:hypothetical protein
MEVHSFTVIYVLCSCEVILCMLFILRRLGEAPQFHRQNNEIFPNFVGVDAE